MNNHIDTWEELDLKRKYEGLEFYIKMFIVTTLFLMAIVISCYAEEVCSDSKAVQCIIGEAENQGELGMLALAVGIRNRGTIRGVYGCNVTRKTPEYIKKQAMKAWKESKENRIHTGNHWENVKAFGSPYWAKEENKVFEYKDHVFYKL